MYQYLIDIDVTAIDNNITRQVCYEGFHCNHFIYRELNKLLLRLFVNIIRNVK